MTLSEKLANIEKISVLVDTLMNAKSSDFISGPEAKNIFSDVLKDAGFKRVDPVHKKEVQAEVKA